MSANSNTARVMAFETFGFTIAETEDKNSLTITFNTAEDAKSVNIDGKKLPLVRGILSALSHTVKGTYAVVEPDRILRKTIDEILDEIVMDDAGYCLGSVLLDLQAGGLVHRVKEIDPKTWYRLNWSVDAFTTEDVEWTQPTASESNWVRHNRNFLDLQKGFVAIRRSMEKGVNLTISWFNRNDKYISERLEDLYLRSIGKVDEANARYVEKINNSSVRNSLRRTVARTEDTSRENHEELVERFAKLAEGTVMVLDGNKLVKTPARELLGRTATLITGGDGLGVGSAYPIPFEFKEEDLSLLVSIGRENKGRFELDEEAN